MRRGTVLALAVAAAVLADDPAAPAADAKRALLLVVAAAALVPLALRRGHPAADGDGKRALPRAALGWLGFVAWSAIATLWGVPLGMRNLATWVGASGILVAAAALPANEARAAARVAAATIGAGSSLWALAQRTAGGSGMAIHGGHGNPNWLGLVLAISLPLSLDLVRHVTGRGRGRVALALAATGVQLPALVLSHSRAAWAATVVALAVGVVASWRVRSVRWAAAIPLVTTCLFLSLRATAAPALVAGGDDVAIPVAWEGRTWIWRTGMVAAGRALPFGAGAGAFAAAFLDEQGRRLATFDPPRAARRFVNASTAHDDWIEIAVESGVPGLLLLAGAILSAARSQLAGDWPAGAASLAAFVVCATGDSPLGQPAVTALLAFLLAATPAPRGSSGRFEAALRSLGARGFPRLARVTLVAVALLLAGATSTWRADRRLTAARDAEPALRLALLDGAARLDPGSGEAALERGLARLELGDARGAVGELERSRPLLADLGADVALGNAHLEMGDTEAAVASYRHALERHPGCFRAHANLVEALRLLGRLDDAEAQLAAARSLQPGHARLPALAERLRLARLDADTR